MTVILELPAYSPGSEAPSYSRLPLASERSLEYRSRIGYQQPVDIPNGVIKRRSKQATLAFFNQTEGASAPVYGPHLSLISGELSVLSHERVTSISLKLQGRMVIVLGKGNAFTASIVILNSKELLYGRNTTQAPCPPTLSFSAWIPTTYLKDGQGWYLPPTFATPVDDGFNTHVQVDYSMLFEINLRTRAGILNKTESLYVPFRYEVRDRPRLPYLPARSPISALKATPEEWQIKTFTIPVSEQRIKGISPIECQMIIPSAGAFGLVDFIPFHIEFCGTKKSLEHFFGRPDDPQDTGTRIRASLVRQLYVRIARQEATRNILLGQAEIRPLPPPSTATAFDDNVTVDYEGQLRVDPAMKDIRTGGFSSGGVIVEDSIELTLTPKSPESSSFQWCKHKFPIKFVTDSWFADQDREWSPDETHFDA